MLFLLALLATSAAASDPPFWWGVGNSAFQAEGEPADSDWRRWTRTPGKIADGTHAESADRFWVDPATDLDLAKGLGANMFRVSIAWERVQPEAGRWDDAALDRYEALLLAMRRRGLEPLVTLHHFALPAWLAERGGLEAPDFPSDFAAYAERVVRRLANGPARARWWMTFNEPMVLVFKGYAVGEWPPGKKDPLAAKRAADALARAHVAAARCLRAGPLPEGFRLGVAQHWRPMEAAGWGPLNGAVASTGDWVLNRRFLDGADAKGTLDYIGINYYGRSIIRPQSRPPFFRLDEGEGEKSDLGWTLYPEGLGRSLRDAHARYGLPLLVSENGLADAADAKRPAFLAAHVEQALKARKDGVPVLGYLHWSLTDNFEWAEGLKPRFGLVELDYATGKRRPRPSYKAYADIIRRGAP